MLIYHPSATCTAAVGRSGLESTASFPQAASCTLKLRDSVKASTPMLPGFHIMMAATLKLILWAVLMGSISANPLCVVQEEDGPFTGGYQYFHGLGYYKLYSMPSYWGYAWKQCKEDGGHLVVIDSDEEHRVVLEIIKNSKREVFIGAQDIFVEGWFFTVTGKSLCPSSYNRWRDGQPDGSPHREEDCVIMDKNGELQDEDCGEGLYFICEIELK